MTTLRHHLVQHRTALATAAIGLLALVAAWVLVMVEISTPGFDYHWPAFAILSVLLVWGERSPRAWIRFGSAGVVTPTPMFAFGMLLIGSPALALCVTLIGTTWHSIANLDSPSRMLLRIGGTTISLSCAGVVLMGYGVTGSITEDGSMPGRTATAIVVAGTAIVVLDTLVAALSMSMRRRASFLGSMQRGLAVRISAEGALLSLAPIWVIGIEVGLMFVPLLGITTVLVFRSTRQALERNHEAHHDPLTGLLNRRSFLQSLEEAIEEANQKLGPAALVMDLDGFKDINDRLGHQLGDALLVAFADRLMASAPTDAVTARFGGDEFAVLFVDSEDGVAAAVAKLHADLCKPLLIENFPVTVGVSIGVAHAFRDGHTPRELLRAADVAMYKAKRTTTGVEYYASCVKGPQRGRINLLGDLDDALRNHELHIHFQPQLRMIDGHVDTVEALIRWSHPEHGAIPPDEFIGLAEQTDLIAPITELVLRTATRGLVNSGVEATLAVNVSPRNLQDPDFADHVFGVLLETGFRADRLELEVTERSIVSNAERCRYTIDRLRTRGVRIAIDDFGIGYSSFQALRTLQVDRVKIDRDFVQGVIDQPRDRMIVASVIQLAHDLGLDVVAEGVENIALWDALGELDCDVAQGYGIAAPMGYPELRGWLSSWSEFVLGPEPSSRRSRAAASHAARPIGHPVSVAGG